LLAAIHRICQPGPRTEVADWYGRTILHSLRGIPPERFTSQAFWDALEKILLEHLDPLASGDDDPREPFAITFAGFVEWKADGEPTSVRL
jgi:hypothetical protein